MYIARPMWFVACSGFPLPVSRYWGLFEAVEISETGLGIPGAGTVRRWLRESPKKFAFTAIAPNSLGESGFRKTKENKAVVEEFAAFADTLGARAVVFEGPETFKPTKQTKTALKSFISWLPKTLPPVVVDLPNWKPVDVAAACGKVPVIAAYDPLNDKPPPAADITYLRLPGPAGHRSRYDDESVDQIAEHCKGLDPELAFCVFRNIDMQANATALRQKLKR